MARFASSTTTTSSEAQVILAIAVDIILLLSLVVLLRSCPLAERLTYTLPLLRLPSATYICKSYPNHGFRLPLLFLRSSASYRVYSFLESFHLQLTRCTADQRFRTQVSSNRALRNIKIPESSAKILLRKRACNPTDHHRITWVKRSWTFLMYPLLFLDFLTFHIPSRFLFLEGFNFF